MKFALFIILLLCAQTGLACPYLYGTWKSDMADSYSFASANPKVTKNQLDFVKYAFGHMKLTFSEKSMLVHDSGTVDVIIEGKSYPFSFERSESEITYLECNKDQIAVVYEYKGAKSTYYYTVVNENEYWVKLNSEIGREYFKRVQ